MTTRSHWQQVYTSRSADRVSWYQDVPRRSLDWIGSVAPDLDSAIIDVGAGASNLVDHLLERGYRNVAALDIADEALAVTRSRLGKNAERVEWFTGDVLQFAAPRRYDVWHDRAVLHFLVDPELRARYADVLRQTLRPGGYALIATFAHGGPTRCSGLPVMQASCSEIQALLGAEFHCLREEQELHLTPGGAEQRFQYCLFVRREG